MGEWAAADWAALIAALAALVAAWKGNQAVQKVASLKVEVDGRLTQLLAQTALASAAEGREVGREQGRAEMVVPIPAAPPTIILVPTPDQTQPVKEQGEKR